MQTSMHVRAPLLAALTLAVAGFAQVAVTAIPRGTR